MDLKKLRKMKEGSKVKILNKIYKIYKISADAILLDNEKWAYVIKYSMKREEDDKEFVLQIPEEDYTELVRLLRAIKRDKGWTFNPSFCYIKLFSYSCAYCRD